MGRVKKIKEIDKSACKLIRQELNKTLETLGKKLGLSISAGNASFSPENATFKLNVATLANDGTVKSKEAESFKNLATLYGLKPEMLNTTFKSYSGESFEIIGLAARSNKYPVLAKNILSGKTQYFKFPVDQIKAYVK